MYSIKNKESPTVAREKHNNRKHFASSLSFLAQEPREEQEFGYLMSELN